MYTVNQKMFTDAVNAKHLKEEEGIQHRHVSGKMTKKIQQSKINKMIFKLDSLISFYYFLHSQRVVNKYSTYL